MEHYDSLEKQMLGNFFSYLNSNRGANYLHWNMRDINYGFAALEHRFSILGGEPYVVEDHKKHDLSRMLIDIYGVAYIGHPRLANLLEKNSIKPRDFLSGSEEAKSFDDGNLVALHQSTLRKVDVLANIAERASIGQLKTDTTWLQMRGGGVMAIFNWVSDNRIISSTAIIATFVGFFFSIYAWLHP